MTPESRPGGMCCGSERSGARALFQAKSPRFRNSAGRHVAAYGVRCYPRTHGRQYAGTVRPQGDAATNVASVAESSVRT
jgi:hypothetical protein